MLNLWVHPDLFPKQDFILNPDFVPGTKPGQLLEIYHSNEVSDVTKHLIVKVGPFDKENIGKERPILQVSLASHIANVFGFKTRTNVLVREVDVESVAADYVEFSFRDQYIGRSDMWRLSKSLYHTCVYIGKRIEFAGCIRAQVKKIFVKGVQSSCGYITENTKPIFRSESAKLFIFIQMSREMWEFDEDGELYYEKAIDGFFTELFQRWKDLGTNHVVSIVLFTRAFYEYEDLTNDPELKNDKTLEQNLEGKWYKDFYKVIIDWETRADWSFALKLLKQELLQYQPNILLRERKTPNGETIKILLGKNSYAFEGNILEAINLALNPFDKHYVDRDLLRTGLSVIIITPGCGRFEVDKKLLRITTERMIDNGIGLDLVCLSKIPLHSVPLFEFKSQELSKAPPPDWWDQNNRFGSKSSLSQSKDLKLELRDPLDYDEDPIDANHTYYITPDWVDCSFYSRYQDKPFKPDKFTTRCKIIFCSLKSKQIGFSLQQQTPHDSLMGRLIDSRRSHEDLISMTLKNSSSDFSRSLPKTIVPNILTDSPSRGNSFPLKSNRLSGTNLNLMEGNTLHPPVNSMINKGLYSRSHSQITFAHDNGGSYYDGNLKNSEPIEEDEGTFLTSSTKPISIKSSSRYYQRDSPQSPKGSFVDGSYCSEKGKYFFKQSPGKFVFSRQNSRQTLINPCNPSKSQHRHGMSIHLRRWEHVFPKLLSINSMKWNSLCTPACLPLTTDYCPPFNELGAYEEHFYTNSLDSDVFTMTQENNNNITEERKMEVLLNEMISQRLSQGYQLIVSNSCNVDNTSNVVNVSDHFSRSPDTKSQIRKDQSFSTSNQYYLSMGRHVHQLTYDPSGLVIAVKRYVRKIQYGASPIPYTCVVWPKCQKSYEPRNVKFIYPHIDYKWNYVDQLACGYQDDLLEPLKFWRTRFILIPTETVPVSQLKTGNEQFDEEEVRINGVYKFLELFDKALSHDKSESNVDKKECQTPQLKPTTDDLSMFVITPEGLYPRRTSVHPTDERLTKDSRLEKIAHAMMNPATGIVKDRRWRFRSYQNAIIGNEFVDWLLNKFPDIETRADAVAFGNDLLERGLYEHCTRRHRFLDGYYFYQIKEEYAPRRHTKGWFGTSKTKNTTKDSEKAEETTATTSNQLRKPPKIEFTKSMRIDIDPAKKSDRRETAILHYDVIYNVENCYHFQLNWLGCTARFIEELLQQWSRNADKYGLKLVEAPVEQAMSLTDNNPFQSPTSIKLSVLPPTLEKLGKKLSPEINPNLYFEIQLVKHFKFILDVEADNRFPKEVEIIYSYHKTPYKYSQYIHRSGVAFIQICDPGEGFLWINNRLYTTHTSSTLSANKNPYNFAHNPDQLLMEFQNFCNNEAALKKFWDDVANSIEDYKPQGDFNEGEETTTDGLQTPNIIENQCSDIKLKEKDGFDN
ncbi:19881_t:CDS:2 [Funneliformis geosporum]|uniref:Vacuolar membrane-associated protein IML1 n=1 Tax=Funneliformis geosporum TaxID=1117311 RepID=A0A9W4WMZ1_9GLOM|nr:2497_t:CDS:2 [Funneliformis geosporum]CAI2166238.1 19881_t:CDS:2 [Funneliformis geosporum]